MLDSAASSPSCCRQRQKAAALCADIDTGLFAQATIVRINEKTWTAEENLVVNLIYRSEKSIALQEIQKALKAAGLHGNFRHVRRLIDRLIDKGLIVEMARRGLARTFWRRRTFFDDFRAYLDGLLAPTDPQLVRLNEILGHVQPTERDRERLEGAIEDLTSRASRVAKLIAKVARPANKEFQALRPRLRPAPVRRPTSPALHLRT